MQQRFTRSHARQKRQRRCGGDIGFLGGILWHVPSFQDIGRFAPWGIDPSRRDGRASWSATLPAVWNGGRRTRDTANGERRGISRSRPTRSTLRLVKMRFACERDRLAIISKTRGWQCAQASSATTVRASVTTSCRKPNSPPERRFVPSQQHAAAGYCRSAGW